MKNSKISVWCWEDNSHKNFKVLTSFCLHFGIKLRNYINIYELKIWRKKKDEDLICQNVQIRLYSSGYPSICYVCCLHNGFYWIVILTWNKDIFDDICGQVFMKNLQIQNENDTVRRKKPLF